MESVKRTRPKSQPRRYEEPARSVTLWLPDELHAAVKKFARLNRMSISGLCYQLILGGIRDMQEEDINSDRFVPPGLR